MIIPINIKTGFMDNASSFNSGTIRNFVIIKSTIANIK